MCPCITTTTTINGVTVNFNDWGVTVCSPCHYSCYGFYFAALSPPCTNHSNPNACTVCDSSNNVNKRVLNEVTRLCDCEPGYYDVPNLEYCIRCDPSCKTCTGGSAWECRYLI